MRPFPGFRHLPVLCTAAWLTVAAYLGNAITSSPAAAAGAPKKLVIIGATAKSSQEIIWQALAAGYQVTGVARNPAQVELRHERLRMLQGDVYDASSIAAALDGDEVVVSMVGPRVDPTKEVTSMDLFTKGTANIIAAMKKKGNKRLLVASSLGVENQGKIPKEKPAATDPSVMWLWNSRLLYADMKAMEDLVRASGLEYVIFRPGFIIEQPARHDLKFSVDQESPKGRMVTYADFAEFVLDQADGRKYLGKTVGIYSDRELKFGVTADFAQLSAGMADRAASKAPAPPPPTGRGNVARGRGLSETCVPCHGETGVSPSPAFPIIAGQQYDYLVSAMLAYLSGTRQDSIMGGAIRTLSRSDIEDLAAFFSTQKPGATAASTPNTPAPQAGGAPPGAMAAAMAAADAARALPAVVPRRNGTSGDARELKACAAAANGLPDGFAVDADGDGYLGICNAAQLQIDDNHLVIKRLINTHCHLDHVFGNPFIIETYKVPLECHIAELPILARVEAAGMMFGTPVPPQDAPSLFIEDNDVITVGNIELKVLLAPGHSPGSLCFYDEKNKFLIGGDVLFFGSIGRTDLPGGNHAHLINSIETRLMPLPDDVKVYSGHGQPTTIGYERLHNPFLT